MADEALVGILLKALGQPSAMVTGRKSFLPGDDRVGMMLSHITPSMMARLAREESHRYHSSRPPDSLRPPRPLARAGRIRVDECSVARGLRICCIDRFEPSHPAAGHNAAPVESAAQAPPGRAFDQTIDATGRPSGAAKTPLLSWPWEQPLPPTPPPCQSPAQAAYAGPPFVGAIIDVFA